MAGKEGGLNAAQSRTTPSNPAVCTPGLSHSKSAGKASTSQTSSKSVSAPRSLTTKSSDEGQNHHTSGTSRTLLLTVLAEERDASQ